MRALVTGAAGFIGSHLAERLVADGADVLGVDCYTSFYSRERKQANLAGLLAGPRFALAERDLSTDDLDDLVEDVDTVFHLAAQAGVRRSFGAGFETYVQHNITGTQRLLEAVTGRRLERFVYASSSSVYGNPRTSPSGEGDERRPESPYGMTKVATEELAGVYHRADGVPVVGLRYFTVYGPRQRPDMAFSRFISDALAGRPLTVLGDGRQLRDFTFVSDIVDATLAAGIRGAPGTVYNVGGGRPVPLLDAVATIAELLGGVEVVHEAPARGDVRATCADGALMRAELGLEPVVSLRGGIEAQVRWTIGDTGLSAGEINGDGSSLVAV